MAKVRAVRPLDGGWGYMVIIGACIVTMVNAAGARSFSIIYLELLRKFGGSAAATAGVGSMLAGMQLLAGEHSLASLAE